MGCYDAWSECHVYARYALFLILRQGVVIYWVSSATFGLIQTWVFDYWTRRRHQAKERISLTTTPAAPLPSVQTPTAIAQKPAITSRKLHKRGGLP